MVSDSNDSSACLSQSLAFDGFGNLFDNACYKAVQVTGGVVGAFAPLIHDGDFSQAFEQSSYGRSQCAAGGVKNHRRGLFRDFFIDRIYGDSNRKTSNVVFLANLRDGKAAGVGGETGEAVAERLFFGRRHRMIVGYNQLADVNAFAGRDVAFDRHAVDMRVTDFIGNDYVAGLDLCGQ